jgi:hypothetical protein
VLIWWHGFAVLKFLVELVGWVAKDGKMVYFTNKVRFNYFHPRPDQKLWPPAGGKQRECLNKKIEGSLDGKPSYF